jgi:hypothetical protein
MVCALFLAGHSTVILDSTSITKEIRDSWKEKAKPCDLKWETVFKVFDTSAEECKSRVDPGVTGYLYAVIDRMAIRFEKVEACEGRTFEEWNTGLPPGLSAQGVVILKKKGESSGRED